MTTPSTLPIAVILPTRNAMAGIAEHLAANRELLDRAAEVIVVDSSEDGTFEFLQAQLTAPNVRIFSRPRGLYESWNFAVAQATTESVYFSTVGDTLLADGIEGMEHLREAMRVHAADVVISPPVLLDEHGAPCADRRWPIHEISERLRAFGPRLLTPSEALLHTMSCVPETILGSSASNLYRREFLAAHPFPEGWGHCADSLWMAGHALGMRVVVTPREVARFVMHPPEPGSLSRNLDAGQFEDFFTRAGESLAQSDLPPGEREMLGAWLDSIKSRYSRALFSVQVAGQRIRKQRQKIADITELLATARQRMEEFREALIASKKTTGELREKLADIERRQGSLREVLRQWVARKMTRMRRSKSAPPNPPAP